MSPKSAWPVGDNGDDSGIREIIDGRGQSATENITVIHPSINGVKLEEEGQYHKDDLGTFSHLSPVTLGIVSACALAAIVVCVVALVCLRSRRRRQKLLHDLTFDFGTEESKRTKSAPASRTTSPKNGKRMSCPDALSVATTRNILVRPLAIGRVPDITQPPERVQPRTPSLRRGSVNLPTLKRNDSNGYLPPELYSEKNESDDDDQNLPQTPFGRLWFSMLYDATAGQLDVKLLKVKNLPGRSSSQRLRDPFVKMFLLPDERTCRISKVKKMTLNPKFYETHSFQVTDDDIKKRILRFSVYDVDRRRVRHSLGHVMVHLKSIDLTKGEPMWGDLEPMVQTTTSLGEIQFSLIYMPSIGKIKLVIHRAKNLNFSEDYPDMDVYMRAQLFYGHRCHRIKRTITQKGGTSVTFNESLPFTVNTKQMDSCSMVISLMLTSSLVYSATEVEHGRVVVGPFMYARGDELIHWQEMLSQPKMPTTRWHSLTNVTSSP